ncbi:ABC transporter ATP-binding protein [Bengtsoniella intestinalis]|uniref:ABC transporter ATP-binding protein n=1 Tax=Bengtsoniella intestinalis TaxID=3073143 RepID=UPI00391F477C
MSRVFKSFTKKEWMLLAITVGFVIIQVLLDLKIPAYMSEVTILVQTAGSTMTEILTVGGYMLFCSISSLLITFLTGFCAAKVATKACMKMRGDIYKKINSFSMADMTNFSTASLITRTTNDITQIQMTLCMGFVILIRAPFMCLFAINKISTNNPSFSLIAIVAVVLFLCVIGILLALTIPKSRKLQKIIDSLNTVIREHLTGVRVVRAYNAEVYHEEKFEKTNQDVAQTNSFVNATMAFLNPFMSSLMSAITLAVYWIGAALISESGSADAALIIFSDMVVFSSYSIMIILSFMVLTVIFMMLPRTLVALSRIDEVITFNNKIKDGTEVSGDTAFPVAIEFKNVSFSYADGDEKVLDSISFCIKKGETAAFIGATGSGKSTIAKLILRYYDVDEGEILIDGINIKAYTQHALREKLGFVSQTAVLFNGDITSNIAFGMEENVSKDRLDKAVEIAQATDFVDKIGLDGRVSQGGLNLSGGQKQRVSIARALYKNAELYIFDDCFSALDYRTDRMLREKLATETKGATKLIVAQRISTVKDANQIIVIDQGRVAGIGTHTDLLLQNELYREIAESQLSKEELGYA